MDSAGTRRMQMTQVQEECPEQSLVMQDSHPHTLDYRTNASVIYSSQFPFLAKPEVASYCLLVSLTNR